jgi:hypothetical protein
MVVSASWRLIRFSHGIAAVAAPKRTKAMLPIMGAPSPDDVKEIRVVGAKNYHTT